MTDLKSMTLEEITVALRAMGEPQFRGKQVFTWLHRGITDFDQMINIPKSLREKLRAEYTLTVPTVARKQESKLDGTIKYLWELSDGNCIETVLMSYHHGNTVCISSQVGCRMGCKFCASTLAGKVRDLRPSEMLDQVLFTQLDAGREISNIVLMGIGEPLDNRANVLRFLELINHPDGMNIGMRHISLSTWLRDYLYISMGGNRCGRWRMYFNQFMTMLLGGLWHGASWNFVIWGCVHGVALCLHKAWQQLLGHDKKYHPRGIRRVAAIVLTFHLVCFSWLFFAGASLEASVAMLTQIFTNFQPQLIGQFIAGYPEVTALMAAGFVLHFLPSRLNERVEALMGRTPSILLALLLVAAIIWVVQVKGSEIQPFIYFKF